MVDPHCRVWVQAVARLSCVNSGEVRWASDPYPVRIRFSDTDQSFIVDRELSIKVTLGGWSGKLGLYIKNKLFVSIALDDFLQPMLSQTNTVKMSSGGLVYANS